MRRIAGQVINCADIFRSFALRRNITGKDQQITLAETYTDMITGKQVGGTFLFPACGVMVLNK